jgi:RNA polymerase sigma-70 factor (ECF subfamily)
MDTPSHTELSREASLLRQVAALAKRFARRLLVLEGADDLAQDIVLECLTNLRAGTLQIPSRGLAPYVRTMVLRRLLNEYRRNLRHMARDAEYERELAEFPRVWMSPEVCAEEGEIEDALEKALASLPPMCRQVYLMAREDHATYPAIAEALGISHAAISKHLVRAGRRIRTSLREQHFGSSPLALDPSPQSGSATNDHAARRDDVPELRDDSAA